MLLHTALQPVGDVDAFWHVLIGYDIISHHRFSGDPAWVHGPSPDWTTTQWASEVLFAALHAAFGWAGLIILNTAVAATTIWLLLRGMAHTTGRSITTSPGLSTLFVLTSLALASRLQERPAILSMLFLLVLSRWCWTALNTGEWPRWWLVGLVTVVWAQFHGYWVMVAVSVAAATSVRFVQTRKRQELLHALPALVVACAAGAFTPAGWYGYQAPLVFREAAHPFIEEWRHPTLDQPTTLALLGILALFVAACRQSTASLHPVPLTHRLWVLGWALFALTAERNICTAIILITPVVANAAQDVLPQRRPRLLSPLAIASACSVAMVCVMVPAAARLHHNPLEAAVPLPLISQISREPGERRVLNDYDLGGQVLALSRRGVSVAIDSRADKYGTVLITQHLNLLAAKPGWRTHFDRLNPTDVLLDESEQLNRHLPALGWSVVGQHGPYLHWMPRTAGRL